MVQHVVQQGECLSSIARAYGLPDWRIIYDDPKNAEFRVSHPNPNLIYPDDLLWVPDREPRHEQRATDRRHPFVLMVKTTRLKIVVADIKRRPVSGSLWQLEIDDTLALSGTTGNDGLIDQEIPADAARGRLEAVVDTITGEKMVWTLALGALDPWNTDTGAQGRLNNLGFLCGRIDGIIGRRTKAATRRFQTIYDLAVDGIPGPITKAKLRDLHGC